MNFRMWDIPAQHTRNRLCSMLLAAMAMGTPDAILCAIGDETDCFLIKAEARDKTIHLIEASGKADQGYTIPCRLEIHIPESRKKTPNRLTLERYDGDIKVLLVALTASRASFLRRKLFKSVQIYRFNVIPMQTAEYKLTLWNNDEELYAGDIRFIMAPDQPISDSVEPIPTASSSSAPDDNDVSVANTVIMVQSSKDGAKSTDRLSNHGDNPLTSSQASSSAALASPSHDESGSASNQGKELVAAGSQPVSAKLRSKKASNYGRLFNGIGKSFTRPLTGHFRRASYDMIKMGNSANQPADSGSLPCSYRVIPNAGIGCGCFRPYHVSSSSPSDDSDSGSYGTCASDSGLRAYESCSERN